MLSCGDLSNTSEASILYLVARENVPMNRSYCSILYWYCMISICSLINVRFQTRYCFDGGHNIEAIIQTAVCCQHCWNSEEDGLDEDELLEIKSAIQLCVALSEFWLFLYIRRISNFEERLLGKEPFDLWKIKLNLNKINKLINSTSLTLWRDDIKFVIILG